MLADLRRPLPQALRPPAVAPRALPEEAARERQPEAGVDARRPRQHVRHRPRRAGGDRRALQRARRATASTPTTGGASRPTTGRSATRTARCTRASARSTRRRTTRCRCCRPTSARAAVSSPTSTRRVLDEQDAPIDGLYATGNSTATVMGRHYLGPGASIANSMVFGYLAARHAAGRQSTSRRTVIARRRALARAAATHAAPRGAAAGSTTIAMPSSSRSNAPGASYTQLPEPMHTSRSISTSRPRRS